MNCEKCGKQIPANLNYCPSCSLAENPSYVKYQEEQQNKENNVASNTNNTTELTPPMEILTDVPVNPNSVNRPLIDKPQEQTSAIKKIAQYILPIYIITIVLYILMINGPELLNITGWDVLGFIIYGQIGIQIGTIILSLVLTFKFINKNINKAEEPLSFKVILNAVSTYFIYLVVSSIISIAFGLSMCSSGDYTSNYWLSMYILPMILPLIIIPISYFLNRKNKINKKEANTIIVLVILGEILKYIISLAISGNLSNISFEYGLLSLWQIGSIIHIPLVAIIPAFISSLVDTKPIETDNKKGMTKEIIIMVVAIVLYIVCINIPISDIQRKVDEGGSKPSQSNIEDFTYCLIPYKTKGGIYYQAYNTKDCWNRNYYLSSEDKKFQQNIYYVDTNSLKITSYVSNVHSIYNFDGQTENLYYSLNNAGPLYELKNDGTKTNIIKSRNPRIVAYHDNQIYYEDYVDSKFKTIDINTYKINEIQNSKLHEIVFGYDKDIYYKNPNEYYKLNRYNIETKKSELINNQDINDIASNGNYYSQGSDFYIKDNILYFMRFGRDYDNKNNNYLYKYNLKTYQMQKEKLNYNAEDVWVYEGRVRIIGSYNNDLYLMVWDTGYKGELAIHKVDLTTYNAEIVIPPKQVHSTVSDENYNQRTKMAELMFNNTAIIDGYLYYSNYADDSGKLYRLNLSNGTKEKVNNDNDSVFFDLIDGYVYYITNDYTNKSNSFYRIKDMKRETIIASKEPTSNPDESRTPWTPTSGDMGFGLKGCKVEQKNHYVTDYYLAEDVICGVYLYKQANGKFPNTVDDIRPFIGNEAVFKSNYEISLNGNSPTKPGVIVISYDRGCGGKQTGSISGWILDADGKRGVYCVGGSDW